MVLSWLWPGTYESNHYVWDSSSNTGRTEALSQRFWSSVDRLTSRQGMILIAMSVNDGRYNDTFLPAKDVFNLEINDLLHNKTAETEAFLSSIKKISVFVIFS